MAESNYTPMTDEELVTACQQEITQGIGGDSNSNTDGDNDVALALDYYYGRLPGITKTEAKDPRASRYVSMDVMDGTEATTAEIMPSFDSEDIAYFEPSGQEDEEQAELESQLMNYLFFEKYDGWLILNEAVKDALLNRNCTVKTWWDERAEVDYEEVKNMQPMMLPQLLQPTKPNQTVEIVEEIQDEAMEEGEVDSISGSEMMMEQPLNLKIKRTTLIGKPVIKSRAPEHVVVNGDHDSPFLHNARFTCNIVIETTSSLIAQGYDPEIVAKLPEYQSTSEDSARSRNYDETNYAAAHESTKLVKIFECYYLIDFDGDGIAERRKVVMGEQDILLANDPWRSTALVGGVAIQMPHKYKGISLFDRLREIQDTKTPIIRSVVNGTALAANPRLGVITGEVNIDDLMTSRTGGIVRMDTPGSVFDLAKAEVPQSAYTLLDFMDKQRMERGGGAVGMAGQASKAQGQGGDFSLDRIMTSMELSNAVIAKTIGETLVRGIFIELHALIREHHTDEIQAKIGGQWVKSYPAEWQERASVKVMIGASHAERLRRAAAMEKVIAAQKELAQTGSVMFDENKLYTALTDTTQLSGIKSPDRYFVDPQSPEGQQKSQQKQEADGKKKQEEMQVQIQMIKSQMGLAEAEKMKGQAALQSQQVKMENDRLKNELEKMKAIVDAADKSDSQQFDYYKQESDLAMELTKLEQEYAVELNRQHQQNQGVSR